MLLPAGLKSQPATNLVDSLVAFMAGNYCVVQLLLDKSSLVGKHALYTCMGYG